MSQLAALDGRESSVREAGRYGQSAMAIAERLREEMPNLLEQMTAVARFGTAAPVERALPTGAGRTR